ncbi:MAG TPA: EAL domain-containing protein [Actinomycetota bacterium]
MAEPHGRQSTVMTGRIDDRNAQAAIEQILMIVRERVGAEVAWVSRFVTESETIPWVVGADEVGAVRAPFSELARTVREHRRPVVLRDGKGQDGSPRVVGGTYIGLPIETSDGRFLGVLSCSSPQVRARREDDLRALRVLAMAIGRVLEGVEHDPVRLKTEAERIDDVLNTTGISMVFQPIVALGDGTRVGLEALARFGAMPERTPDRWFAEAARVDRGVDLELAAVRAALAHLDQVPAQAFLAINASARTLMAPGFERIVRDLPHDRIVIELTDRPTMDEHERFMRGVDALRAAGLGLAVDDAGGGFSAFSEIAELQPAVVKLDSLLVIGVATDPVRRALIAGLVTLAREIGATTTAEGVEGELEAGVLAELGVDCGQGKLFGAPAPIGAEGV